MFERYTEIARTAIFFARHEAGQYGSASVETEHLLLGILRADPALASRLFQSPGEAESIRTKIEERSKAGGKAEKVDMPLSKECKRVAAYANQESERLTHRHIGPEHLLMGILHEKTCLAAQMLRERGVTLVTLRQMAQTVPVVPAPAATPRPAPASPFPDLTDAARKGALSPVIGRHREIDRTLQILSRRTRKNPVLIGEPGVGKTAIVEGVAQSIADGNAPRALNDRPLFTLDAATLIAPRRGGGPLEIPDTANAIVCIEGLFEMAGAGSDWALLEALRILEPHLASGLQCIATGTPLGYRQTAERAAALARHFEVVPVAAPDEEEALEILRGVKPQYEKFHGVSISDAALQASIPISRRFLKHRQLPDRAIDLIDDACAQAQLRRRDPNAEASQTVTPDDIEQAAADRSGIPVSLLRSALQQQNEEWERISKTLAEHVPAALLGMLAAHLAQGSPEDAERLADAIRRARKP